MDNSQQGTEKLGALTNSYQLVHVDTCAQILNFRFGPTVNVPLKKLKPCSPFHSTVRRRIHRHSSVEYGMPQPVFPELSLDRQFSDELVYERPMVPPNPIAFIGT